MTSRREHHVVSLRSAKHKGWLPKMACLLAVKHAARVRGLHGSVCSQNLWNIWRNVSSIRALGPGISAVVCNRQLHSSLPRARKLREYDEVFQKSIEDPESFWAEVADDIDWYTPYSKVMDNSDPPFTKWWVDYKCTKPWISRNGS